MKVLEYFIHHASFWHWLGTLILVEIIMTGLADIFKAAFSRK
jgi:hypothetical protein